MAPGGAESGARRGDAEGGGSDPQLLLPGVRTHIARGDEDPFGFPGTSILLYEC